MSDEFLAKYKVIVNNGEFNCWQKDLNQRKKSCRLDLSVFYGMFPPYPSIWVYEWFRLCWGYLSARCTKCFKTKNHSCSFVQCIKPMHGTPVKSDIFSTRPQLFPILLEKLNIYSSFRKTMETVNMWQHMWKLWSS